MDCYKGMYYALRLVELNAQGRELYGTERYRDIFGERTGEDWRFELAIPVVGDQQGFLPPGDPFDNDDYPLPVIQISVGQDCTPQQLAAILEDELERARQRRTENGGGR